METFINFLDNIGYSILSVIVVLIFGILIIKNILKQIKVILIASRMDNSLVGFVVTLLKFGMMLALVAPSVSA